MVDVLNGIVDLLKANLTGYKTIQIGDPTITPFTYARPAVLISPMQKNVSASNKFTNINEQSFPIQIFVLSQDYPTSQDREGILKGCELADEVSEVLENSVNRQLGGIVDGKYLAYDIDYGYFLAQNKHVFSSSPRITATYYKYEDRDLQPSGL